MASDPAGYALLGRVEDFGQALLAAGGLHQKIEGVSVVHWRNVDRSARFVNYFLLIHIWALDVSATRLYIQIINQGRDDMKLKISTDNATKIFDALATVNGKANSFTISSFNAVVDYAEAVEKMLHHSQLPKAERAGVIAVIKPAGPWATAYKYAAKSTAITIERGSKDWYLTGIAETSVYPKQKESTVVKVTPAQRDSIARKALEPYTVIQPVPDVMRHGAAFMAAETKA